MCPYEAQKETNKKPDTEEDGDKVGSVTFVHGHPHPIPPWCHGTTL